MSSNATNTIHQKLNAFVKRYYQRDLAQGLVISLSGLTGLFVLFILAEYFFRFSHVLRATLFFSFLAILLFSVIKNVLIPFGKMAGWLKQIGDNEAAKIIGNHFPEIGDQLLNTIQLEKEASSELVLASINQKVNAIQPFNFKEAISFKNVTRLTKWALIPLLVVILIAGFNPGILSSGAERIVNYNEDFKPENPYSFEVLSNNLEVFRNEDFNFQLVFNGDKQPKDVYIQNDGQLLRLQKTGNNSFSFLFRNVQKGHSFQIKMDEFFSPVYSLELLEKPVLSSISIAANYPKYTGKKNEVYTNTGDITVPEGSKLKWTFNTQQSKGLNIAFKDTVLTLTLESNRVEFEKQVLNSTKYSLSVVNGKGLKSSPLSYSVSVIKDGHPEIKVKNFTDTINPLRLFHSGLISDDYGLKSLVFRFSNKDTSGSVNIPIQSKTLQQSFNHSIDLNSLNLKKGEEVSYYFEVFDNDAINGSKSTRSVVQVYKIPSENEIEDLLAQNSENIKDKLNDNLKRAQELQNEFDEIRKMLLEKKNMDWSDKSRVEQFLENQKQFEEEIEKLNFENQKNNFQREQLSPQEEEILQKQEKINELFEQLMDEETKKLYEELERLMEELNKEEAQDVLEQIDLSNEELEKELDRTLELFKQMEFEQKLEESISKLEELGQKQEDLAKETEENKELSKESLQEKQEELQKEFEEVKKDLDDLKEKNEELENKRKMDDMQEEKEQVDQAQQESKEQLSKDNKKKSSKQQKKAADSMKKMAQKMQQMQQQQAAEQQMEDINSLRQILENLISLSVDQEDLMQTFKKTNRYDPQFPVLAKKQGDLKAGAKIIEDSLMALSKRQIALQSVINKEILDINYNMSKSIDLLRERHASMAQLNQQYIMTSANNLALILDESLQQMQNQMMQQSGSASCNKPGGKPGNMKSVKKMQEQLNQQIQQMKQQMKEGNKKGKQGKKGRQGMAKNLAKMAAEQNAIKDQLKKINDQQKKQGKGGLGELDNIQKNMEETERDILNKNITRETILRQQEIMTKLLEAEKALKEREFEEKRESKKGKNTQKRNPKDFDPYKSFELNENEQLKTVPPSFNLYYKRKINEYFNTFDE